MNESLRSFYAERAELAYSIEHLPRTPVTYAIELVHEATLREEIKALEAAFVSSWHVPRTGAAPLLPWCSVCGDAQRPLLPGRLVCDVCEANMAAGTITPGVHAEAPQEQEHMP